MSPWRQALVLPESDQALADLLRVPPKPLPHLHLLSGDDAANKVREALKRFRRFSVQDARIARRIVGQARCHADNAYSSVQEFARQAQARPYVEEEPCVTMLTGPEGVGKSILLQAIDQLFSSPREVDVPHVGVFPLRCIVRFRLQKITSRADRMNIIGQAAGMDLGVKKGGTSDLQFLQRRLYQVGACLLMPDELQFLTMSDSNAQVASILLEFTLLGLPLVYAANYSLGHKLAKRPPEEIARLLSDPIVMLPDAFDDPGFRGLLDDIAVVLGVVDINFDEHARTIHRYTFGLRRLVRRLFYQAYRIMRRQHACLGTPLKLSMHHIDAAYEDRVAYGKDRLAVKKHQDDLRNIGKMEAPYHCPFELQMEQKLVQILEADRLRDDALNQELYKQSRTREERAQQEEQEREQRAAMRQAQRGMQAGSAQVSAKTVAGSRRTARPPQPATAEELLRTLNARRAERNSAKRRR